MEQNPYKAPDAIVADAAEPDNLAGRGARLGAAFIDGLIAMVFVLPLMFGTGVLAKVQAGEISVTSYMLGAVVVGFVLFALIQAFPLAKWAQTWGKRAVGIRIAHLDGTQPSLSTLLLRRFLPMQAAQAVPLVGNLLMIVDQLFIFRADRRCVHDLIAHTRVVKA